MIGLYRRIRRIYKFLLFLKTKEEREWDGMKVPGINIKIS